MESYIEAKKNLYILIHEFLEESDDECRKESFEKLINIIGNQQIEGDAEETRQFLEIIKSIGEHHHRDQYFNEGMNQLLFHYKDQIKQILSNLEIFKIFENNKKIVLFLIQKGLITISDEIYKEMINKVENNGNLYWHFFIPELENFVGEEKMKFIKNELLKKNPNFFVNYEMKRQEGENDSYICSLIRQDSVEEFISYVNRNNISLMSKISSSFFETNPFLIDNKNTALIEYSAFFGSIQIFRYLLMNNVKLNPSLWLYTIHSKNAELIHLLESNEISPPNNYEQCLIESIKCHHNDIADYIDINLLNQTEKNSQQNEEIISNCIKYHNYGFFQNDIIIDHGFFYLSFYHYDKLFELLLKKKEEFIEKKMIHFEDIQTASEKNEVEVIYYYLLKMHKISQKLFNRTKIKQIAIPSSINKIGDYAFSGCSSLIQITIPSSINKIGDYAFSRCSSLTQITIPSSVISIGEFAFDGCSSLKRIAIPFSVTSISESVFDGCSSLIQVTIPSSVTSIGESSFDICLSLTQITIPSSVTEIGYRSFSGCSSLTQIEFEIPSSLTSIGSSAFSECSSLTQITIPSSVTSIGSSSFFKCSKLTQIAIPSSVTSIGHRAFSGCSSLTQVTIPSSINKIEKSAFSGCSSLTQIKIPSSINSIEDFAFYKCSSLKQITISFSVTKIGKSVFNGCSSLTQIIIPSSVTEIGASTFSGCSSLAQIDFELPSSVISIGESSFDGCSSLTQIIIPSSVTSIGKSAFFGCSSLTQIIIPSFIVLIGSHTFSGCSSLTQIKIPSSVTSIEDSAFSGCSSLRQIEFEIPSSVTLIGKYAFSGCSSLTQITIPSSVTSIENSAFSGCNTFSGCSSKHKNLFKLQNISIIIIVITMFVLCFAKFL